MDCTSFVPIRRCLSQSFVDISQEKTINEYIKLIYKLLSYQFQYELKLFLMIYSEICLEIKVCKKLA